MMASNSIPAGVGRVHVAARTESASLGQVAQTLLAPLASLKLTVVLFVLSIFLIYVGTLAQVDQDMWQVINNYFHSWLVVVPLQVLFPKTWFPTWQSIPGQFPFPGGLTLGTAMFINLLAAHSVRFKPQAKGARLWLGALVILAGALMTWAVIVSGHNGEGLQDEPPISWSAMWLAVKSGVALCSLCLAVWFATVARRDSSRRIELILLAIAFLSTAAAAAWLFASGVYLGDSGMRILWQLIKAGAAALILLPGCILVFGKRGGIVLIHGGIGLMMLGELLVGTFVTEERIMIDEGDTADYASDIRSTELAIIDASDPQTDDVVAIPLWVKGRESSLLRSDQLIQHADLPFDVEIVDYLRNSTLVDPQADKPNPATAGKGLQTVAEKARPGSGADASGEVDMASAYVKFLEKGSDKEIGTYLLSQVVLTSRSGGLFTFDETVPVHGKDYRVELRFKRTYKPYALRLLDVRKDDYIGTSTPRNYSSDLRLTDAARHVDREVKIWMNNPLRYAGETFYQSGYHMDPSGTEATTLQVVRNTGWMIPYVACVLVSVGLFAHFVGVLVRFLRRLATNSQVELAAAHTSELVPPTRPARKLASAKRRAAPHPAAEKPIAPPRQMMGPGTRTSVGIALALVLLFGGWLLSKARPAGVAEDAMNVPAFGRLPLVYEGRVKPFDTLARNSLRVISTKERLYDGDQKRPAMVWLLDVISGSDQGLKHRVVRIDNMDVLATLKLDRRKGNLYAISEIEPRMEEFRKQVSLASGVAPEEMSVYQRKVLELDRKLQLFFKLREAFRMPEENLPPDEQATYLAGMARVGQDLATAPVPYAVPTSQNGAPAWEPFVTAVTRLWAKDLAAGYQAPTTTALADKLSEQLLSDKNIDDMVNQRLLEMIKSLAQPGLSETELEAYARDTMAKMPSAVREKITGGLRGQIAEGGQEIRNTLNATLDAALGPGGLAAPENQVARNMWNMLTAYRQGDHHVFNQGLEQYHGQLAAMAPEGLEESKTNFEAAFNHFAPFYHCAVVYLVAFVLTKLGWLCWPLRWNRPFLWAAFGLILVAFLVHTWALGARIYISGRPPVTNLYSSAIFIGWAAVVLGLVLELIFRLGIGNSIAAVSGFATLVIAHQLAGDGDTFTVLQAVLDTQFWLATHVVSVTLGYATTFVAGLLGVVFVLAGIFTPALSNQVGQWTVRKILANMIYGIICFALFFSFVGTVLGGLWADDSWGRFWGWDPKENGALMIVLWNALLLHARWGGMIRERGLALLAIGGNVITSWSWFGVNELGVGLHSYGFTEGVLLWLGLFVGSQLALIALGVLPQRLWWSYAAHQQGPGDSRVPAEAV